MCFQISPAGPFRCWESANDCEEINVTDLTCLGCFTSLLLVQDSKNKLADKECDQSYWLKCFVCLQPISLELLSGTFVNQLPTHCVGKRHKLDMLWIQAVTYQQIPDPLSDMNHTRVSRRRVQTRCLALVPVTALHVTRNEEVTTQELEQRKRMLKKN